MSITHIKSASRSQGFPSVIRNAVGNFCGRIVTHISGAWNALTQFVNEFLQKIFSKTEPMPQPTTPSQAALKPNDPLPTSGLGPFDLPGLPADMQAKIMGWCEARAKISFEQTGKSMDKIACDKDLIIQQTFIENLRLPIELTKDAQKKVFKTSAELKNEVFALQFKLTIEEMGRERPVERLVFAGRTQLVVYPHQDTALNAADEALQLYPESSFFSEQFIRACKAMAEGKSEDFISTPGPKDAYYQFGDLHLGGANAQEYLKYALSPKGPLQFSIDNLRKTCEQHRSSGRVSGPSRLSRKVAILEAMQNRLKEALIMFN